MRFASTSRLGPAILLAILVPLLASVFFSISWASPGDISLHDGYEGGDGNPEDFGAPNGGGQDPIDSVQFLLIILNLLGFILRFAR
jgi:hypothetical protein